MSNINEQLAQGQKEHGVGSRTNYYKFEKGDNRLRILTAGEVLATHFFGKGVKASTCYGVEKGCPFHGSGAPKGSDGKEKKPSIKYTCYVLSKDGIQLADLPYSVIKQVGDYQTNVDYSFDSFPMPYDITVKYNPDSASPNDMYKVLPSPKREEVSEEIKQQLEDQMSVQTPVDHVTKKKDYQIADHKKAGIWISPEKMSENKKNWRERTNAEAKLKNEPVEPAVDYPSEQIDPSEITF